VVKIKAVALVDDVGDPETQPLQVLLDHRVRLRVDSLRIRVLDTEHILSSVALYVSIVQDRSPCMTEMERAGRVRGKSHYDTPLCFFQIGELPDLLAGLCHLLHKFRGQGLEAGSLLCGRDGRNLVDHFLHKYGCFPSPGLELRVLPHHHPDHSAGFGYVLMFDRVLEGKKKEGLP